MCMSFSAVASSLSGVLGILFEYDFFLIVNTRKTNVNILVLYVQENVSQYLPTLQSPITRSPPSLNQQQHLSSA